MEIDIRDECKKEDITAIRFGGGYNDLVSKCGNTGLVGISGRYNGCVYTKDIDNLILALQKAKELWG